MTEATEPKIGVVSDPTDGPLAHLVKDDEIPDIVSGSRGLTDGITRCDQRVPRSAANDPAVRWRFYGKKTRDEILAMALESTNRANDIIASGRLPHPPADDITFVVICSECIIDYEAEAAGMSHAELKEVLPAARAVIEGLTTAAEAPIDDDILTEIMTLATAEYVKMRQAAQAAKVDQR